MSDEKRQIRNSTAEFLIFTAQAGEESLEVRYEDETIWLTQKLIAELFGVSVKTISEHFQNIFASNELAENSVVRKFRITAADGKSYDTQHYNLDAIIPHPIPFCYALRSNFKKPVFNKSVVFSLFNLFSPNGASFDSPGHRPGNRPQTRFQALKGRHKQRTQLIHAISPSITKGGDT